MSILKLLGTMFCRFNISSILFHRRVTCSQFQRLEQLVRSSFDYQPGGSRFNHRLGRGFGRPFATPSVDRDVKPLV